VAAQRTRPCIEDYVATRIPTKRTQFQPEVSLRPGSGPFYRTGAASNWRAAPFAEILDVLFRG